MNGPVVVGVDGSPKALAAVDEAALEASLRGVELRVVHAFLWPAIHAPPGPSPLGPSTGALHESVERIVAEAVERARSQAEGLHVAHAVIAGEASTDLLLLARLDAGHLLEHQTVDLTRLVLDTTEDVRAAGPNTAGSSTSPNNPSPSPATHTASSRPSATSSPTPAPTPHPAPT